MIAFWTFLWLTRALEHSAVTEERPEPPAIRWCMARAKCEGMVCWDELVCAENGEQAGVHLRLGW